MQVEVGGRRLRYRRVYRPRMHGWYVDVFDEDGEPIVLGARLSPGSVVAGSAQVELPVALFVVGPSPYRREDLGEELHEYALTEAPEDDDDEDEFIVEFIDES